MVDNPQIDILSLPDASKESMDFLDSSFFKVHGLTRRLPTPAEVTALLEPGSNRTQPPPVKFEELDLLVKFGPHVSVNEAQCLWMIRRTFGNRVPVPEVYAWRVDGQQVFIYMQLVRGHTLKDRWDSLTTSDRTAICHDLREMLTVLRSLKPQSYDSFIGSIGRGPVTDIIFEGMPDQGPFPTVKTFHDWLSSLLWRGFPNAQKITDPWRPYLPDDEDITFSHADLHRANIIISPTGSPRVITIIDWAQAGWYPAYWEYYKACYTALYTEEWRNIWIPKFLDTWEDESLTLSEYTHAIGSV